MKKFKLLTILLSALALASCTKEQDIVFDAHIFDNVDFSVVNLSVGEIDSAESSVYTGNYSESDYDNYSREFEIEYYDWKYDYTSTEYVRLPYKNELWAAGNNELQFTFRPSCAEEKSATFTMPDGKTFEVTAEKPTFTWTVTPEALQNIVAGANYEYTHLVAKAESEYKKGNSTYKNQGYILIEINSYIISAPNGKWYANEWGESGEMAIHGNVDFSAINLTVGEPDSAKSATFRDYYDPEGYNYRSFNLELYCLDQDSVPQYYTHEYYEVYGENELWAAGDNDIEITYNPQSHNGNSVKLVLPDGKTTELTAENPTATWTLDRRSYLELTSGSSYNGIIEAYENYKDGDITYDNHGYIYVNINTSVCFDRNLNLWLLEDWTSQDNF